MESDPGWGRNRRHSNKNIRKKDGVNQIESYSVIKETMQQDSIGC